ncbi:MAG: hypothetical protein JO258_07965, partial [Alphaproteobacteria bacterium]|nr:hypothetical protein [Alphaproteobacteria bacterium]
MPTLPFVLLLVYFRAVDTYDRHFFDGGGTGLYNLLRGGFAVYLFFAICAPGFVLLGAVARPALFAAPPAGRLAAAFFCGAALWHGALLVLGFLDLYIYPAAAALAVAAVALAAGTLRSTLAELGGEAA